MKIVNKIAPVVTVILFAFQAFSTQAANDVNINITGKVIASPCTTINGGSANLSVPVGDNIQAASLASPNSGTPMVKFDLPLTVCPLGTENVKATFSGTADAEDATLWKNVAANAATNTAVELSDQSDSTILSNGSTLDAPIIGGAATYKLQARAVSKTGAVIPGDISSTIVVAFEYQ